MILGDFECIQAHTPKTNYPNSFKLEIYNGDEQVAKVYWRHDEEVVEVVEIFIESAWRRRGLATSIYNRLREETGKKLKWIRNALASKEMKLLVERYIEVTDCVESDDGNIIILKPWMDC